GAIETAAANHKGWRLNPDWLELLQGLPLGWTGAEDCRAEFAEWLRGWSTLDSWKYGPGWWMAYPPGTEDLPGGLGAWEGNVPRVTNCANAERCRLCATSVVPVHMVTAVDSLVSLRDMQTS